jgi:phosphopantothenoylcysteine decarboxylase/phosphopantothenate--cysteine ligase
MRGAVLAALPWCDILLMAAAVADYTPVAPETERKRHKDGDEWVLRLRRTRDILRDVAGHPARRGKTVIGFSLDVDLDLEEGARKLREKSLDGIVVNGAAALGADRTEAVLLRPSAPALPLGTGSKREVADALLRAVGPPLPP